MKKPQVFRRDLLLSNNKQLASIWLNFSHLLAFHLAIDMDVFNEKLQSYIDSLDVKKKSKIHDQK